MSAIAALLCILLAFVSSFTKEPLLFDSLTWFVGSISFSVLNVGWIDAISFNRGPRGK